MTIETTPLEVILRLLIRDSRRIPHPLQPTTKQGALSCRYNNRTHEGRYIYNNIRMWQEAVEQHREKHLLPDESSPDRHFTAKGRNSLTDYNFRLQ